MISRPFSDTGVHGEASSAELEARLESVGRRISMYLRHLPLPERVRHELALETLHLLASDPGDMTRIEAKGMRILYSRLRERKLDMAAMPAPPLSRSHMKPEEMDRRPWVRAMLRIWCPAYSFSAQIMNTAYADMILYALLLAGLYALGADQP